MSRSSDEFEVPFVDVGAAAVECPVAMKFTISASDMGGSEDSVSLRRSGVPSTSSFTTTSVLFSLSTPDSGLNWAWIETA
jgi:hypothetical protein